MSIIEKAKYFAIGAHEAIGHKRKYTGTPYWWHMEEVARILMSVSWDEEIIATAWLHDVVEDTKVEIETIHRLFGNTVSDYVDRLTDKFTHQLYPEWNRAFRKRRTQEYLSFAPIAVKTIKVADLISNAKSIIENDHNFAKVFVPEMKDLLFYALYNADKRLVEEAYDIVEKYEAIQENIEGCIQHCAKGFKEK